MKIDVPFFKQNHQECGLNSLRMAAAYHGKAMPIQEIARVCGIREGRSALTIEIACGAAILDFPTEYYSGDLYLDNLVDASKSILPKSPFAGSGQEPIVYMELLAMQRRLKSNIAKAEHYNVMISGTPLSIDELSGKLTEGCVPIVSLDWGVVTGSGIPSPHGTPFVGYTEKSVYVHHGGSGGVNPDAKAFLRISKKLFEKAYEECERISIIVHPRSHRIKFLRDYS